jgi:hypothetical protein
VADAQPENRYRRLLERLEKSPLGPELLDENQRQRKVFDLLAAAEAPVARELGQELAADNVSLRGCAAVPAYHDVLAAGLQHLATVDFDAVADRLEKAVAAAEKKQAAAAEDIQVVVSEDAW